jgi:hypothetical protein
MQILKCVENSSTKFWSCGPWKLFILTRITEARHIPNCQWLVLKYVWEDVRLVVSLCPVVRWVPTDVTKAQGFVETFAVTHLKTHGYISGDSNFQQRCCENLTLRVPCPFVLARKKIVSFTPYMYSFMENCKTFRKISVYLLYWL